MIESASSFLPSPAPASGAFGEKATPSSPGVGSKSGRATEAGLRLLPTDIIQLSPSAQRKSSAGAKGLTEEEKAEVADLKRRDAEIRRHEQAHANAGGPYAGAPSYTNARGPDARSYAVAGTTPIDVTPISGDPAATVRKMETVKRAALSPAEPSAQDRKVAAQADAEKRVAQAEAARERAELPDETGAGERPVDAPVEAVVAAYGAGAGRQPSISTFFDLIA